MSDAWERWQATGLIDRWAAIEPTRCDPTGLVFVDGHWSGAGLPGSVLAATIEAIDSHKWTWSLQGPRKSRAEHMGFVYHPKREDGPPWKVRSGDSPAEALLAAYLKALEVEAAS